MATFLRPPRGRTRRLAALAALVLAGCGSGAPAAGPKPPPPEGPATAPATRPAHAARAVLAGGCFWCVESVFEHVKGVKRVISGFAGGRAGTARYSRVVRGGTDHAESVAIVYDPRRIRYGKLLQIFMATHHPTQKNRQGPDVGRQYRSAIFYADARQKRIAERYLARLARAGTYDEPVATTLEPLAGFYPAARKHQDFVERNPNNGYVRRYVPPKLRKLRAHFPELATPRVSETLERLGAGR